MLVWGLGTAWVRIWGDGAPGAQLHQLAHVDVGQADDVPLQLEFHRAPEEQQHDPPALEQRGYRFDAGMPPLYLMCTGVDDAEVHGAECLEALECEPDRCLP